MERRTIVCYLGGIWRRLEQLERIYGRFPSVDRSSRFAGVPNLGKPLYGEKTVYIKTHSDTLAWCGATFAVDVLKYIDPFQRCKWCGSSEPYWFNCKVAFKETLTRLKKAYTILFIAFFTSHRSPLSERLEQAKVRFLSCSIVWLVWRNRVSEKKRKKKLVTPFLVTPLPVTPL